MRRTLLLILVVAALAPAFPGAQLVLQDGQVLEGVDVRRESENYLIELESGRVMTIPVELVASVRLSGKPDPISGLTRAVPQQIEGPPANVSISEPKQLEGMAVTPPTHYEQTAAIGEPSRFQQGVVDPYWHPETDWDMDQVKQNNFNPADWSDDIIDPNWEPESDWVMNPETENEFNPSSWSENVIDPSWNPTSAFPEREARPTDARSWGSNVIGPS